MIFSALLFSFWVWKRNGKEIGEWWMFWFSEKMVWRVGVSGF